MRFLFAYALASVFCACGTTSVPMDGGDGGRACPPPVIVDYRSASPAERLPRCTRETFRCASACGEDIACVSRCLAADSTPAFSSGGAVVTCSSCVNNQQVACLANRGCGDTFAAAQCCPTVNGLSPSDRAGIERVCSGPIRAFSTCQTERAPRCYDISETEVMACFGGVDDAGVADAGRDDPGGDR